MINPHWLGCPFPSLSLVNNLASVKLGKVRGRLGIALGINNSGVFEKLGVVVHADRVRIQRQGVLSSLIEALVPRDSREVGCCQSWLGGSVMGAPAPPCVKRC